MFSILLRRTPDGVRGLKFYQKKSKSVASFKSHSGWGAWIEILSHCTCTLTVKSHSGWGAWIEIAVITKAVDNT